MFSERFKQTMFLRTWGWKNVPLIFFVRPSVVELTEKRCVISIPFRRRTKNHLGSMYFGVLCTGADVAGGLIAMNLINASGRKISLIFKDFRAEFLKRAEGDVLFTSEDGDRIREFVAKVIGSGERENMPVRITATVPSKFGDEPVAQFDLTLSLKLRA